MICSEVPVGLQADTLSSAHAKAAGTRAQYGIDYATVKRHFSKPGAPAQPVSGRTGQTEQLHAIFRVTQE